MKKEGPKYIIEDNKLDKLIKHCQEQFIAGRTPIRNPPLGDPFFSKMNDQHDSLISVFIHYTINNFKQQINQMNLCFNQNQEEQSEQDKELCEDIFRKSLQIVWVNPGFFSSPKFEFMNYPGVLYHYIEVFKEYDFEESDGLQLKLKRPPLEIEATLEIKRPINQLQSSNYGMVDKLFVTKNSNSYRYNRLEEQYLKYHEVKVSSENLEDETKKIINILNMKTKYQDYYSAFKDGWFKNNNSNDTYNMMKSVFDLFKWK
jgi:hypothetical protein